MSQTMQKLWTRLSQSAAIVRTIYTKELVDTLRDRRTLATMLLVPMVIYPLAVLVTSEVIAVEQARATERIVTVRAYTALPPPVRTRLDKLTSIALHPQPLKAATDRSNEADQAAPAATSSIAIRNDARAALASGALDVVLAASATAAEALESLRTAPLTIYYDETRPFAPKAADRVREALIDIALSIRGERLAGLGLDVPAIRPLAVDLESVATSSEVGGQVASLYLPMLILMFITLSSFYPAVDLTAGEKERGTLATLLTAPIDALEIVWGKYLAVVTVGMLAGLLNVGVMSLTMLRALATAPGKAGAALPELSIEMVLGLLVAVVLLAALIGALMLVTATLARSFRDASNLLAPVLFLAMSPAILTMLPGTELTPLWAAVPIANGVLMMKSLLVGHGSATSMTIVAVSTAVYTAALLALAARIFRDERALFSTDGRRAELGGLLFAPPAPGVTTALAFAAVLFIANYYGGLLVTALPPAIGVATVQIIANAMPAILLAAWLRPRVRPSRLLPVSLARRGAARGITAGLVIGGAGWLGLSLPILWIQQALMPEQSGAAETLRDALGIASTPLPVLVLTLAVVPAVCEELAFRGVVLQLLRRRLGLWGALVLQAVLFGLMHGSAFRLMPTAVLGLVLGLLAVRSRSLLPGIVAHAMTNGIAVVLDRTLTEDALLRLAEPTPWSLLGVAALAAGLVFAGPGRPDSGASTGDKRLISGDH